MKLGDPLAIPTTQSPFQSAPISPQASAIAPSNSLVQTYFLIPRSKWLLPLTESNKHRFRKPSQLPRKPPIKRPQTKKRRKNPRPIVGPQSNNTENQRKSVERKKTTENAKENKPETEKQIEPAKSKAETHKFNCDICDAWVKTKISLIAHIGSHEPKSLSKRDKSEPVKKKRKTKRYECEICQNKFLTAKNLENHIMIHNTTYICELCGAKLKTKYGLTKHLRTHTGEKPCLCNVCGKTFTNLTSQKVHFLKHIGQRPYVCDICGKKFTQRSSMMLHRKNQHPGSHPAPPPIKIAKLVNDVETVKPEEFRRVTRKRGLKNKS